MRESQGVEAQGNFAATALRLIGGSRPLLAAAICTAGVNVLALTGPAYMLLLYDRVLPAHAGAQLLRLTLGMLLLYGLGARVDLARHEIFAACARRADRRLSRQLVKRMRPIAVRDLDRVRAFLSGQAPAALCDLPWMPLYVGVMSAASSIRPACINGGGVAHRHRSHRRPPERRPGAGRRTTGGTGWRWPPPSIRRQPKHAAPGWCSTRGCVTRRMRRRTHRRLRRIAPRAAIGIARPRRLSCHDRHLPSGKDARCIDHACTGLGSIGNGDCTLALFGGSTRQRHAALCAPGNKARVCAAITAAKAVYGRVRYGGRVQIVLRSRSAYARRAMGAGARSATSGLRPTAE